MSCTVLVLFFLFLFLCSNVGFAVKVSWRQRLNRMVVLFGAWAMTSPRSSESGQFPLLFLKLGYLFLWRILTETESCLHVCR